MPSVSESLDVCLILNHSIPVLTLALTQNMFLLIQWLVRYVEGSLDPGEISMCKK